MNNENSVNLMRLLEVSQKVISEEVDSLENRIWIPDPDLAFRLCNIVETRSDKIVVGFRDEQGFYEKRTVPKKDVQETSLSHYCDNMCQLTELNEASVLHNIKCRYDQKLIHTYSGLFCVVVNPWQNIPLYSREMMNFYMSQSKIQQILPPHVYSVAQTAYDGILKGGSNQSILITGESGAGKTENTKKIIEYLIFAADEGNFSKTTKYNPNNVLDSALISCGIALEAFSNAKTIHNNNSSRVGKFIRIDFNQNGKIHSARIDCYLLEKSRVVSQNKGDRNFHIFYQLLSAAFPNLLRKTLGIEKKACDYRFLNQGAECHDHGIDDATFGQETDNALDRIGLSWQEKLWVYEVVAICMLIGEMRFGERAGMDLSYPESMTEINKVTHLLDVKSSKLVDALTQPSIKIGENVIRKNQNLKKTLFSVAALTKIIYERLFNWIVSKCNSALERENTTEESSPKTFIGVLDMAGFEIMNSNSFEQFCINYTNEKLQQFFNHFMFIREQTEYLDEGIEWSQVNYADDLQPTIEMIEKPMGLLSYLQEECIVPNGSDNSLLEKLVQNLTSTNVFSKSKQSTRNTSISHFTICHYAGQVSYNIDGWLEKNRDVVDQSILEVLGSCQHPLLKQIFPPIQMQDNARGSRRGTLSNATVSSIYKEQLLNLLQTLHSTSAHFIRCIVPNYERKPFQIKGPLVLHQLRCNGVLEGVRICRRGYPNRLIYDEFIQRYKLLVGKDMVLKSSRRETAALLFEKLGIGFERYQLGKNKVFCRAGLISELEAKRKVHIQKMIVGIQSWIRWYSEQKFTEEKYASWEANVIIQRNTKQYAILVNWDWYRLWRNVRQLIPMQRDKKHMVQLQKDNEELVHLCEDMRYKNQRLQAAEKVAKQELEKMQEERIEEKRHLDEIRQESKKNEDLLELMAKRFDEQHQKIMRLHNIQKDNEKALERMEEEKKNMQEQIDILKQKYRDEKVLRENMEEEYNDAIEKAADLQEKMDKMLDEMNKVQEKWKEAENRVEDWKEKSRAQGETISELQATIADFNDRIIHFDSQIHNERNIRRKCEDELDDLEEEIQHLKEDLEKSETKNEAMREQLRSKENAIKRLEKKFEDKTDEMDNCIAELKKIHKNSQTLLQDQLEEYKRKCLKLESENKQQKVKLDTHLERESSVESDYGFQTSSLGRRLSRQNSSNLLNTSTTSLSSSTRTLNSRSEYGSARSYELGSSTGYGLHKTTSNSRLHRTTKIMEVPSTISSGYGLSRSPSMSQIAENERKISQLERQLQQANTDCQLLKREIDVYKSSLQDTEREKDSLNRQMLRLTQELESSKKLLEKEEKNSQLLDQKWRSALKDVDAWKQKYEDSIMDSKHELMGERKKNREKIEDLTHSYELKLGHLTSVEKCRDQMHSELMQTQQQLDQTIARLNQMEKMSRSQANVGETWESQYRVAMQEIESLRDENAALKMKIRRQYKQIEILTQQSEIDERVSDLEIQVDKIQDRIQITTIPVEED